MNKQEAIDIVTPVITFTSDEYSEKLEMVVRLLNSSLLSDELKEALTKELIDEAKYVKANTTIVKRTEQVTNTWYEVVFTD